MSISFSNPQHLLLFISIINFLLLSVKLLVSSFLTSYYRVKDHVPASEEDRRKNFSSTQQAQEVDYENKSILDNDTHHNSSKNVDRMKRIHANEVENLLLFLFVAGAFLIGVFSFPKLNDTSMFIHCFAGSLLFSMFTVSRYFFFTSYFFELQPWRSISYLLSVLLAIITLCWAVVAAFT